MVVLMGSLHLVSRRTYATTQRSRQLLEAVPLSRFDPGVINLLTLGYRGVYDDFLAIWLVQIFADPQVGQADPAQLNSILQAAVQQQPKLESVYMLSCFVMTFEMRHPEYCDALIGEGIKAMPQSWRLPATAGYVAAFKSRDPSKASLYYALAAAQPGAPGYFKSFSAKLAASGALTGDERRQAISELLIRVPGASGDSFHGGQRDQQQEGP